MKALIAQEVAETKYTADVRPLFQLAKQVAGKSPKTLVSDGAANFHEAYNHEFRTLKIETGTEHIRHIRLAGDYNNNKSLGHLPFKLTEPFTPPPPKLTEPQTVCYRHS